MVEIKENGKVSARKLHDFLDSKQKFANWINNYIKDFDFEEGKDFIIILLKSTGGRPIKEYDITVDMAKELSMLARNEKGKQARKYFISIQKEKENYLMSFIKNSLLFHKANKITTATINSDIVPIISLVFCHQFKSFSISTVLVITPLRQCFS